MSEKACFHLQRDRGEAALHPAFPSSWLGFAGAAKGIGGFEACSEAGHRDACVCAGQHSAKTGVRELLELEPFEEGKLPRRLLHVTMRKP